MDCFGTYFKIYTCPNLWWNRVQSATEWTASVHTLHMSKPVMQLVFKVLRNGLLNLWCNSCSSATEWTASVHTLKFTHVQTCDGTVFKVLRNGLLRYILCTCPNLWCNSFSKCYGMDCLTCDVTRVQSATEWTASVHTLKFTHVQTCDGTVFKVLRNGLLRYILCTCPNLWCNSCSKCYGVDCFGAYFTHVQTCDVTRVQSATEWTASVHTLHMSKPVM